MSVLLLFILRQPLRAWYKTIQIHDLLTLTFCTNQQPPQRGGAVPDPVWVGSKWLLAFPRVPVTPSTRLLFFRYAAPWTIAEGQHTASTKSVSCFLFLFSPALLLPFFVSSFFSFSWWAVLLILIQAPSFLALCALEMWPGEASQCNAAPAPNGPSKVLTTFPVQIQSSRQLSLLELPPRTVTPSSDSSDTYTSTVQSGPLYWCCTHASPSSPNLLSSICPFYIPFLCPFTPSLAPGRHSMPPASSPPPDYLRVLQWNAGGLRARSTELLHFLSSHPVNHICIQESNLNSSSSFRIPGFSALRSDRTHSRSGILSPDATHASGGVIIFVRQGLSFSELSTTSHSSLDPYSDYVGINISLDNSSLVSFLKVYTPLFAPPQRMAEPIPSLPPFFLPSEISSFWGTSIAITPLGLKRYFRTPRGGSIRLGHLLWPPPPQWPWHIHPSPSLLWQSLLSWHLLCSFYSCFFLLLGGASGPGFWPSTNSSIRPFLSGLLPQRASPLPSIFRKLAGMALPLILTLTVHLQRNTRLFLFPLLLLSLPLWHWMRPNLPFLSAASNALLKPDDLLRWKERLV